MSQKSSLLKSSTLARTHRVSDAKYHLNCGGWSRLMARHRQFFKDDKDKSGQIYSGRLAGIAKHDVINKCLKGNRRPGISLVDTQWTGEVDGIERIYTLTPEDVEQIQTLVDHVFDRKQNLGERAYLFTELPVSVKAALPIKTEGWRAYLDVALVSPHQVEVIEIKMGTTPVHLDHADDSRRFPVDEQTFLGVAALLENEQFLKAAGIQLDSAFRIRLTIYQPNGVDMPEWQNRLLGLEEYRSLLDNARTRFNRTLTKNSAPTAGSWCGYCPLQSVCLAFASHAFRPVGGNPTGPQTLEEVLLQHPEYLPLDRVQALLPVLPLLRSWIRGVEKLAITQAHKGMRFPGYKLVRRRSHRKWRNEDEVREWLKTHNLPFKPAHDIKLRSPKQVLSLLKAGGAPELSLRQLQELVVQPEGSYELVPEIAPTPEVKPLDPKSMFKSYEVSQS